jgi:malate dehydrogenase (oxaloacetate-decarboxylating)(NADP+)
MTEDLRHSALEYHQKPKPGKLEIKSTKPLENQQDLALAYTPGVADACREIESDPLSAADYTVRGNLVAVVTNGTAVLGLGAIGPLASKPVMEGKAVLFKKFANIDVFDIEVDETDPQAFIDTVSRLEPSFGGINLEDIKAPECFVIEQGLKERMRIPVFHDDQHGTAIVVCAAILNGLRVVGKRIEQVRLVTAGAGAAALACLKLLMAMGLKREHILLTDIAGVVYRGREEEMDSYKAEFAVETESRTLEEALQGADIFLGLSAGGVLKAEWLPAMGARPLILALANPVPEIHPREAKAERPDAVIATGRSDYPNQVNNVLCFPFLFRGALDVGATEINTEMKLACVNAIAGLARVEASDVVLNAYGGAQLSFGPEYLIPKPFDPRLMETVPLAVARAAMESGVASRQLKDFDAYRQHLQHQVFRTGMTMKPVFDRARQNLQRVVFAEGEEERVLRVCQQVVEQGLARPILVGRHEVIERELKTLSLSVQPERDFDLLDPIDNPHYEYYCELLFQRLKRQGYSPQEAAHAVRGDLTALAAVMVANYDADAMICGVVGRYTQHLKIVEQVIGRRKGVAKLTSLNALVLDSGTLFITDAYVQREPDVEDLAQIVEHCAEEVRWFGVEPKVALLSHSNFGSHDNVSSQKMRAAAELLNLRFPDLEVDGEMHSDLALSESIRESRMPASRLSGKANLLVMPNQDAAHITFNTLKLLADGIPIGPILVGSARPAHIATPSVSVRGLLNLTALAAVRAGCQTERN